MKVDVTTDVVGNGVIVQSVRFTKEHGVYDDMLGEMRQRICTHMVDTMDEQMRAALIHLGWKPPEKES